MDWRQSLTMSDTEPSLGRKRGKKWLGRYGADGMYVLTYGRGVWGVELRVKRNNTTFYVTTIAHDIPFATYGCRFKTTVPRTANLAVPLLFPRSHSVWLLLENHALTRPEDHLLLAHHSFAYCVVIHIYEK